MKLKRLLFLPLLSVLLIIRPLESYAFSIPYDSYNYDYREYIHFTPAPYVPAGNINISSYTYNGEEIGAMVTPQDICKDASGNIYIADTGNNRIVVLNKDLKIVTDVIDSFDNNGTTDTFNQPYGVCVSADGNLYVADSQNKRVVELSRDHTLVKIISEPKSESIEDGFVFTPLKITVDYAGRVYVIAQNMFEGIMVFETNGNFSSFFGTIDVPISLWDKFWKRIATKEERLKQKLYIPTEFTGLDIDPSGFVYSTNIDSEGIQGVRRLNPKGEDVIKKGSNKNLGGDLVYAGTTDYSGPSQFTDVVYRQNGIYSCLDKKRGRIFSYDHEGNLLYIFGGLGSQRGTFKLPVAIEDMGDKILVLDATKAEIISFDVTEYGRLINEAVSLRYEGNEASAVDIWRRVLEIDEDNELANVGIGKAYLTSGDYESAMKYLKLGMNKDYYSIAFRRFRNGLLSRNAGMFLTGAAVIIVALSIVKAVRKRKSGAQNE